MRLEPFTDLHLAGSARLLAARHQAQRRVEPLLPADLEDEGICRALLARSVHEDASGVAAVSGSEVLGYLLGTPIDDVRGRHVWIRLEHHGWADGRADVLAQLYAHLADGWVRDQRFQHHALVPVTDPGPWLSLCFAHEQVHALRETAGAAPSPARGPALSGAGHWRFRVRRAGPEDIDAIEPLIGLIYTAHAASPVFTYIAREEYEGMKDGTLELLREQATAYWIAEADGEVVAYLCMRPVGEAASTVKPRGSVELALAATHPRARGSGVGVALFEHALAWARDQGYAVCVTDWKMANPSSSTFWPKRGFRPFAYRLRRVIDPRLSGDG